MLHGITLPEFIFGALGGIALLALCYLLEDVIKRVERHRRGVRRIF